jgi:apolipoprotein N-acyltransferase
MRKKKNTAAVVAIIILLVLALTNGVWLIVNWQGGALIALALYLFISLLFISKQHFQAGVIAGVMGFGIHLIELFGSGTSQLNGIERVFFYANLILPIPLIITSYLASPKGSDRLTD